jgi:ADP-ribose pyrophosphatase YjhB (NUDIX family)
MLHYTNFRYCPKCGSPQITNFHEKGMRCAACEYIYYHNSAAAVAGIIETEGGIVLTKRGIEPKAGFLDLPGGFVDYQESFEQALVREIKEEIGAEIFESRYLGSFPNKYVYRNVTYFTTDVVFVCWASQLPEQAINHEITEIVVVRPEELNLEQVAFDSLKTALQRYREKNWDIPYLDFIASRLYSNIG